jgi:hypothetical protein
MSHREIGRRNFLKSAGVAALAAAGSVHAREASAQIQVPNSSGTESAKLKAPANATDCHMHIYDPARFPMPPSRRVAPTNAAVPEYRLLQRRIGTTRVVSVHPALRPTTGSRSLNLGSVQSRGLLFCTHRQRCRTGHLQTPAYMIRFSLGDRRPPWSRRRGGPLAKRIADLGWRAVECPNRIRPRRCASPPRWCSSS